MGKVWFRERARGVVAELQRFLDACERQLAFDVCVVVDGGVRTDAAKQASYAAKGTSNAATLEDTPHGRGAALDVMPCDAQGRPLWAAYAAQAAVGGLAESMGLQWGGRFRSYDGGHVQVPWWRTLPFPPGGAGLAVVLLAVVVVGVMAWR